MIPPVVPGVTEVPGQGPMDLLMTLLAKLAPQHGGNARVRQWVEEGRSIAASDPRVGEVLNKLLSNFDEDAAEGESESDNSIAGLMGDVQSPI